jgi:transposase-like protein
MTTDILTPTTLPEFCKLFPTVESCEEYLIKIRWPSGFMCPRCGGKQGYPIQKRAIIECAASSCRYHASLTAGTVMHRSKQDLRTWFWAAYLITTFTPGISGVQLQRQLGLSRYETAFNMLHKLRAALVAPGREQLHGEVEIDEVYIGGKEKGRQGRGVETKALVIGAIELIRWTKDRPRIHTGRVRLRVVPDASAASLVPFVIQNVKKGAIIHTDGWLSYNTLKVEGYDHRPVVQGKGEDAKYMLYVHHIFSNLKTWLLGTHHGAVKRKHLQAYLNEYTYRFNRRDWRGPAFIKALGLATHAEEWPTYDHLYHTGESNGWSHPDSHHTPGESFNIPESGI